MKKKRKQSLGEEIANSTSHGLMAIFGLIATILLINKSQNVSLKIIASLIFGIGIIILYTMSTLYHSLANESAKSVFRRFDHLSIYILIGGTFAPPLLLLKGLQEPFLGIKGFIGLGLMLFIVQWILIAVGIVFKSIWVKKFVGVHVFFFLLMGWSALIFMQTLMDTSANSYLLVLLGGLAYSVGVIFFALSRKVKYFHFIWHLFTALGTILQFIAIYNLYDYV